MLKTVQNGATYLVEHGAGEPILFLHGAPDSADMWSEVIACLQDQYHCFAPDLPGFARSVAAKDFVCSLDTMAQFIDALIETFSIPTPLTLVVGDFGGTYGLAWAATHPEKVQRLAIVGGTNFSSRYQWHKNAKLIRTPLLGELGMALVTRSSNAKMMHESAPRLPAIYIEKAYDLSLATSATRRMMLKLYRSINPEDFVGWEDRLHALTAHVPTLVLWGDQDPFIAPAYAEQFGAQHVEHFSEYSHWLAVEAPDLVADRLKAFLAS